MCASTAAGKPTLAALLVVTALLSVFPAVTSGTQLEMVGPNIDELVYTIVPEFRPDIERALIKARQVDIIPRVQGLPALLNMSTDPDIKLYRSPQGSTRMSFLVFNTRRSPLDDVEFRRAVSCLVDRGFIANTTLGAWAEPLNTFVPKASIGWMNQNASAGEFDVGKAMRTLRDAGYRFDLRTRKITDPQTGRPLREMTLLTPKFEEAAYLWIAGNTTSSYASTIGIPIRHVALPESELVKRTIQERDFDLLVYDHDLGYPPFELFNLLHSTLDRQSTNAYSGIRDPELDRALEGLWFGIKRAEAVKSAHDAQKRLSVLVPYVPIYSTSNVAAASPQWGGLVNMPGKGIVNPGTYLGVRRVGKSFGERLTQSMAGELRSLNPILANEHEWEVLNQLYTPLLAANPETLEDMPMLAKEWETEKWTTSTGKPGMRITFRLADGVMWHDGEPFTAEDVRFCIEFLAANRIPQFQDIWMNLAKVETPDKATVQIYLNEAGYRYLYAFARMTFLPRHVWKDVKDYKAFRPWEEPHPTVKGLAKLIGQGPFIFAQGDLKKSVTLVWNPLYFGKTPQKPGLLERQLGPLNASAGESINVQYRVLNHTRSVVNDAQTTFRLTVRKDDEILLDLPASYSNGLYTASIDTGKIGSGEYACEFNAAPYGLDKFTIEVSQSTVSQSAYLYALAGGAIVVVAVCIYLATKRTSRKRQVKPTSGRTPSNRAPTKL